MEVYLIRHPRVNVSPEICYGQLDVGLTEHFPAEVEAYRQQLPQDFDAVYSSPLSRCRLLAEALPYSGIQLDDRLMEYNFGDWEGLNRSEIDPITFESWHANFVQEPAPGGESFIQFYDRVRAFYADLSQQSHQKVLLVAHSGVKRCTWAYLMGIPLENVFRMKIGFGEVMKLQLGRTVAESRIIRKE